MTQIFPPILDGEGGQLWSFHLRSLGKVAAPVPPHGVRIGGKGGASPNSLHTMLEGATEYVNARWT